MGLIKHQRSNIKPQRSKIKDKNQTDGMLDETKWPRKVGLLAERPSCGVDESFLRDIYFRICSTICHIFRGDTSDKQHHNIITFCTNYLHNFVFSKAQSQSKTRRIIFNNIWQKSKKKSKKKKRNRKLNLNPKLVCKNLDSILNFHSPQGTQS